MGPTRKTPKRRRPRIVAGDGHCLPGCELNLCSTVTRISQEANPPPRPPSASRDDPTPSKPHTLTPPEEPIGSPRVSAEPGAQHPFGRQLSWAHRLREEPGESPHSSPNLLQEKVSPGTGGCSCCPAGSRASPDASLPAEDQRFRCPGSQPRHGRICPQSLRPTLPRRTAARCHRRGSRADAAEDVRGHSARLRQEVRDRRAPPHYFNKFDHAQHQLGQGPCVRRRRSTISWCEATIFVRNRVGRSSRRPQSMWGFSVRCPFSCIPPTERWGTQPICFLCARVRLRRGGRGRSSRHPRRVSAIAQQVIDRR
ncbi:secreted protein [Rhodococcus opacus]|uniref:Secreted protein n=1 Tax=Rhodococcus opacus TaxID=37919 RepID=A0A1B1K8E4_RHOOP|nr:secreted protein [Rhodococcus opacus]